MNFYELMTHEEIVNDLRKELLCKKIGDLTKKDNQNGIARKALKIDEAAYKLRNTGYAITYNQATKNFIDAYTQRIYELEKRPITQCPSEYIIDLLEPCKLYASHCTANMRINQEAWLNVANNPEAVIKNLNFIIASFIAMR